MIKVSGKLKIYFHSALGITAVAIVLCTLSYLFAFDSQPGYFDSGALLPMIFKPLCAIAFVWYLSSLFFLPKNVLDGACPVSMPIIIASVPAALVFAFVGVVLTAASFLAKKGGLFAKLFPHYTDRASSLLLIAGLLTLIAVVYFVINALTKNGEQKETCVIFGFALPLSAILMTAVTYFDYYLEMNAPVKLTFQLAMLSFAFFSLYELRAVLGKPMPRLYLFFGMTAMLFCGVASLPQIVAYCAGVLDNTAYLLFSLISLVLLLYTAARLSVFVAARGMVERIAEQNASFESFADDEENDEAADTDSNESVSLTESDSDADNNKEEK